MRSWPTANAVAALGPPANGSATVRERIVHLPTGGGRRKWNRDREGADRSAGAGAEGSPHVRLHARDERGRRILHAGVGPLAEEHLVGGDHQARQHLGLLVDYAALG